MTRDRFPRFASGVLLYNLLVIMWGAYVRASVSGDGCGNHWPTCGGTGLTQAGHIKTLIEFTHRASVGVGVVLVILLVVWALRAYPKGHPARLGAGLALFFTFTESIVGAGLVLYKLVAHNASGYRALAISGHLCNTFLLLTALTLTLWWGAGGGRVRLRGQGVVGVALTVALLATLLLGVSGAVTALGDTLYPAGSLTEALHQDFAPTAHLLIRLRVFHPVIAILVGLYTVFAAGVVRSLRPSDATRRFARALTALVLFQIGFGFLNVFLLAPVPMQLAHLLLADLFWILLVFLSAAALSDRVSERRFHGGRRRP